MINQYTPFISLKNKIDLCDYIYSNSFFTEHKVTRLFEERLAEYIGRKYCVVVNSGTTALFLATKVLCDKYDINDIIVPDYTMIACANGPSLTGYNIRLIDVDRDGIIDSDKFHGSDAYSILIDIPLNGRVGYYNSNITIEDFSQAFGSKNENGMKCGSLGDISVCSFSMHKIIQTGQGGAVFTNDEDIYKELKGLKNFGRTKEGIDEHVSEGYNFKFTDLQAALGLSQLDEIDERIEMKNRVYDRYYHNLGNKFMKKRKDYEVLWFIDCLFENRDEMIKVLSDNDIQTRLFYRAIHTQYPYNIHGYKDKDFPNSLFLQNYGLWLPSSMSLDNDTIDKICEIVNKNGKEIVG